MKASLREPWLEAAADPASAPSTPRVVIAHDYLTQRGGAERVLLAMAQAFPDAPIVTSVYEPDATFAEFRGREIRTTWLSRVPAFRRDPRRALPLLADVWSKTTITDADVVLCSSTGWAHGVQTDAAKVVYCHNPARWLYQADEYLAGAGLAARMGLNALRGNLRAWDRRAAYSASAYVANSTIVSKRIGDTYAIDAPVMHPPATVASGPLEPVPGVEPGFLLTVGRARGYKNTDAVARAVDLLGDERLVIVGGLPAGDFSPRITGLTNVSDAQLRWLYQNADALVACAYEDFGLTPIESYTYGTPAVVLRAGGYLDTTVPGLTGEFVDSISAEDIMTGIGKFRANSYDSDDIRRHALSFSPERFARRLQKLVAEHAGAGAA